MKKKRTYKDEVEKLLKAIDISIDSFKTYPPKNWTSEMIKMVSTNLEKDKTRISMLLI